MPGSQEAQIPGAIGEQHYDKHHLYSIVIIISIVLIVMIIISIVMVIVIVQYLDDMILEREKANDALREELTKYVGWCQMLDQSQVMIIFDHF